MKASQIILEEFKSVSLIYGDVIENCDKIENQVLDIFASFKRLAQAYKDALYMEGEISKRGNREFSYQIVVGDCEGCGRGLIKTEFAYECSG